MNFRQLVGVGGGDPGTRDPVGVCGQEEGAAEQLTQKDPSPLSPALAARVSFLVKPAPRAARALPPNVMSFTNLFIHLANIY